MRERVRACKPSGRTQRANSERMPANQRSERRTVTATRIGSLRCADVRTFSVREKDPDPEPHRTLRIPEIPDPGSCGMPRDGAERIPDPRPASANRKPRENDAPGDPHTPQRTPCERSGERTVHATPELWATRGRSYRRDVPVCAHSFVPLMRLQLTKLSFAIDEPHEPGRPPFPHASDQTHMDASGWYRLPKTG